MIRRYAIAILVGLSASTPMIGGTPHDNASPQAAATGGPVANPTPAGQTRTLLPDGRWLFIGGEGAENQASVWNPVTNVTSRVPLSTPRAWHTATILADGTVLVAGGRNATTLVTAIELFDAATGTFAPVPLDGVAPRAQHTATLLTDGRVLVAGGSGGDAAALAAEIWDLQTHTAVSAANAPNALAIVGHTATLLPDGRVELSGGRTFDGQPATGRIVVDSSARTIALDARAEESAAAPFLAGSLPADGARDVLPDVRLAIRFSSAMRLDSITAETIRLTGPGGIVLTQVIQAEEGRLVFVWPATPLQAGAAYTLAVAGSVDRTGASVGPASVSFTIAASPLRDDPSIDRDAWIPDRDSIRNGWRSNRPPSPWESLAPLMAPPGVTAISGRVLTLDGRPLPDVSLEIEGDAEARSDRTGRFLLVLNASTTARRVLHIDGAPASRPMDQYGFFEYGFTVNGGVTNVLPFTIWMPRLDIAHQVTIPSPTVGEVVVRTPYIPGLELHLPPGTTIVGEDGKPVTTLGITPIPVDRTPFPLPDSIQVPVYFTIQPGGAYVRSAGSGPKGAWLVYPNYRHDMAGQRIQFYQYDPAAKGWYVYGLGTVTADGSQVKPDPKTRIYSFTGAMINGGNSPPNNGQTPGGPTSGDPVDPSTGVFLMHKTDLYLPDLMPVALTRVYNSGDNLNRPFGRGMTHPYAMFMWSASQYNEADLILPEGGKIHFVRTSAGSGYADAEMAQQETTAIAAPPTPFYKSILKWNGRGWDLTLKDGTVYVFGDTAPLQSIRDRYGNQTTITWSSINQFGSGSGNILRVTGPSGRSISFTYDTNNRVQRADDSAGRRVLYTYDPATGNLLTVTDPEDNVTTYTWDANNRLATIKDGRNIVYLTNHYDANGRVDHQTLADPTASYTYAYTTDLGGNITQTDITNPRGYTERLVFNSSHYVVTDIEAVGQPEQRTTTYERPPQPGTNFPTAIVDGLNRRTEFTYDDFGHVRIVKRLANTANPVTATYTYEPKFFQLATVTDPLLHQWTIGYDANGRLTGLTDPLNHQTGVSMNGVGQITAFTDPLQHVWQTGYTGSDPTTFTNPAGSVWRAVRDGAGRIVWTTDPLGRTTTFVTDKQNRVRSVTGPQGGQSQLDYDPNGRVLSLTDALSHVTAYTYDASDRMETRRDPLLNTASYGYDKNGNITQVTDRKSQVTSYQYDALDRLRLVTYGDDSTTQYTYDAGDRLRQIVDSNAGTITRDYDDLDRLTLETAPEGNVSYTHDAAGRRSTMTVAGQPQIVYGYDAANRLTSITQGTTVVTISYDDADRRSAVTFPNGIVATYGYDDANEITSLTYALGETPIGGVAYTYDGAGNRTGVSGSWARTGLPTALSSATYDAANRIQTWAGQTYSYDLNGNLETDGVTTFVWNARQQLTGISGAGFGYDGVGRRRSKSIAGTATNFLYDDFNIVQEQSSVGTPTANLLTGLGIDETFTRTDSTGTSALLVDGANSILEMADGSGILQTHYTFDPFGLTTVAGAASANALQFTGRENDGSGLYFYRARYYSPSLQQFVSEDPLGFDPGKVLFGGVDLNIYGYVGNNPLTRTDPLGLDWVNNVVDYSAGLGDSLLWGAGPWLRDAIGVDDVVNRCSGAYTAGSLTPVVIGGSRLAYAGIAKGISMVPALTGEQANVARNVLKVTFRAGAFPNYRWYPYAQALAEKGSDAAVKAAAGRTDNTLNELGAVLAGGGAVNGRACGCR